MCDSGSINNQAEFSSAVNFCSPNCSITEKQTKLSVTRSNSLLKSLGEKKARERNIKIARGHQMFKNMESALSDGYAKRKLLEQRKKEERPIHPVQARKMVLSSKFTSSVTREPLGSSVITADELIAVFDLAVSDRFSVHDEFSNIFFY